MMFFRVVLCLAGLLLYLVVRELSADYSTAPAGQSELEPVTPFQANATSPPSIWAGQPAAVFQVRADNPRP